MQHTRYLLCTHYVGLFFPYLFFWTQKKKSNLHDSGGFRMSDKASRGIQGSMAQCNKHGMTKKKDKTTVRRLRNVFAKFHTHQKSELPCNPSLAQLITQLIKEWMQALFSFFIFKHLLVLQRSLFASATPRSVLFTLKRHPRFQRLCCGINLHHFRTLFQLAGSAGLWSNLCCYQKWCVYFTFCTICTCA